MIPSARLESPAIGGGCLSRCARSASTLGSPAPSSRGGVLVPIARRRHRIDGVGLSAGRQERTHHQPTIDLDAHDRRTSFVGVLGDDSIDFAWPAAVLGARRFHSAIPTAIVMQMP